MAKRMFGGDAEAPPEFTEGEFPERSMIARIYRVDTLEKSSGEHVSVEFDGLDEDTLEECLGPDNYHAFLLSPQVSPFGLIRIELAAERFKEIAQRPPVAGAWFAIKLTRGDGIENVIVEHSQLTARGYVEGSSGGIRSIEFIANDDEPPPVPLGATVPIKRRVKQVALNGGIFPESARKRGGRRRCLHLRARPAKIIVRDVGQASFATALDARDDPLFHFDAGWPVSFNGHTAPVSSTVPPDSAPVILSHWDWDHLHGYYVAPSLRSSNWFVPVQTLGPGASRVAAQLDKDKRLFGYHQPDGWMLLMRGWTSSIRSVVGLVAECSGPAGNRNQTGLAMALHLKSGRSVLLTGDADYDHAIPRLHQFAPFDAMVVTHHGARFGGNAPLPRHAQGHAVVSFGDGNKYGHPHPDMQSRHPGWTIEATAPFSNAPRGDRCIS